MLPVQWCVTLLACRQCLQTARGRGDVNNNFFFLSSFFFFFSPLSGLPQQC
uniref:Uncharacterized protein n=1 Tax=Anguilla anguilla TaxID=7936 RepID=A0A0E9W7U9_ANGAN